MIQVEQLISAACEQTSLSDFGDPAFRDGLSVLVSALNCEAKLTDAGMVRVAASITATLAQRLRVEEYLRVNPQLLDAPIDKPLFVFGLPRTGTTLAINLLASDPARRIFMRWEAFNTVPPAAQGALRADPRFHEEQARLEMSLKYVPHISAMHHEDADSATECQFAMSPSFCSQVYDSQYHIPSYTEWFLNADYTPAFRYHKRLMQLLQQHNRGRWTFKNPWHPLYLDALSQTYPDAQLVMTHRDPVEVLGSACSLIYAVRQMFSDDVDPAACGQLLLRTFDAMIARIIAFEEKHGANAIHHINYKDLVSDPLGEIHKVYDKFAEPLTIAAEATMKKMLAANPKGKHGKHEYRLEDYGLSADGVRSHFANYCERYGVLA